MKNETMNETLVTDPVCGMQIDPASAAATSQANGKTYYFCAASCKAEFDSGHGAIVAEPEEGSCCGGCGCSNG